VSRFIGFLFLKNLLVLPVENTQATGRLCYLPLFPWDWRFIELHPVSTHGIVFYVDIRMSSLIPYPLFKSWIKDSEYLLLIVHSAGFEPAYSSCIRISANQAMQESKCFTT
jgi:hypothetical protein